MNEVKFYRDDRGREPVAEFIKGLVDLTDKDSRINREKILDYIKVLKIKGKAAGEPFVKHIDGEIWELRPISHRILFAEWEDGDFILLHILERQRGGRRRGRSNRPNGILRT